MHLGKSCSIVQPGNKRTLTLCSSLRSVSMSLKKCDPKNLNFVKCLSKKLYYRSMISLSIGDFFFGLSCPCLNISKKTFFNFARHHIYNVIRNLILCFNVSG